MLGSVCGTGKKMKCKGIRSDLIAGFQAVPGAWHSNHQGSAGDMGGRFGDKKVATRATTSRIAAAKNSQLFTRRASAHLGEASATVRSAMTRLSGNGEKRSDLSSWMLAWRSSGCISMACRIARSTRNESIGFSCLGVSNFCGSKKRVLASIGGWLVSRW